MMIVDTISQETQEYYKGNSLWKPWMKDLRLRQIANLEELDEYLEKYEETLLFSWDVETSSLEPSKEKIVGHCLCFDEGEAVYVPTNHTNADEYNLDSEEVWQRILKLVETKILVVFNLAFEGEILKRSGFKHKFTWENTRDVLIYNWLHNSDNMKLNLKAASQEILNLEMIEIHSVPGIKLDKKAKGKINFGNSDPRDATLYAAADPLMTLRIYNKVKDKVEGEQNFICKMEHSLLEALSQMKENPVYFDRTFLKNALNDVNRWIARLTSDVYNIAGYEFNLGSASLVGKFLTNLGIDLPKTKTGKPATNDDVLSDLGHLHPVIKSINMLRKLKKEKDSYITSLLDSTSAERPYGIFKFKSAGAPTGRFASGGVEEGDINFIAVNAQSIPNANKYKYTKARLVKNPPISDMDAQLFQGAIELESDEVTEDEETENG